MFNEDLLTQCKKSQFKRQNIEIALLPNIINEIEEYEVEEIQNHRKKGCSMQFLIHWKRNGNEHNQWIVETGLLYAKEAIQDY